MTRTECDDPPPRGRNRQAKARKSGRHKAEAKMELTPAFCLCLLPLAVSPSWTFEHLIRQRFVNACRRARAADARTRPSCARAARERRQIRGRAARHTETAKRSVEPMRQARQRAQSRRRRIATRRAVRIERANRHRSSSHSPKAYGDRATAFCLLITAAGRSPSVACAPRAISQAATRVWTSRAPRGSARPLAGE